MSREQNGEPDLDVGPETTELELRENEHSTYPLDCTPPEALVIHCMDPRFQAAFRRFITEDLGLKNHIPLVLGGSIHAIGSPKSRQQSVDVLWEQIKFTVRQFDLRQVIIINHEECRWYEAMTSGCSKEDIPFKAKVDLVAATKTLLADFAGIEVRAFWAGIDGDTVSFSEVHDAS